MFNLIYQYFTARVFPLVFFAKRDVNGLTRASVLVVLKRFARLCIASPTLIALGSSPSNNLETVLIDTSRATTTVDAKIVSGLFDRTTLPDECFKKVVSYMGSLEPRRPWRKPTTRANWKRGDVLT